MESPKDNREYKININPRILELLGPHLYTNIYFVLAELIANAYDAGAKNVYIVEKAGSITVEDDGSGMSYEKGDIEKYLDVAVETRTTKEESIVQGTTRKKMGRKGIGKLAALSASENVHVMTIKDEEKSGFILSRHVGEDNKLTPLPDEKIKLEYVRGNGTSIVMTNPDYSLNKTIKAIKKNLLKIFPLINKDFVIHIITLTDKISIEDFDKEMIENLGALIIYGKEFDYLSKYFNPDLKNKDAKNSLLKEEEKIVIPLKLKTKTGEEKEYRLEMKGWFGVYRSTSGRKDDPDDFPDNFISLLSNGKLGEYNILPTVGKNYLQEVFFVGQVHVDLFEETELPDMSLSNRQGYKVEDPRYEKVIAQIRELIPKISNMRSEYVKFRNKEVEEQKSEKQKDEEESLRNKVEKYKKAVSKSVTEIILDKVGNVIPKETQDLIEKELNNLLPLAGLKRKIDSQKRKILICHDYTDKALADVIYKMLSFNKVPDDDIIYTNCDSEDCRVPYGMEIWEYLRNFFVDSYSDKKMYVIYVTSKEMAESWGAVSEVGAGWITESKHTIFNILDHEPKYPLNIRVEWQNCKKKGDKIFLGRVEFDKFVVNIRKICEDIGYTPKSKELNVKELGKLAIIQNI